MRDSATDWGTLLTAASQRAMAAVSRVAAGPQRSEELGTGASGDRTLVADRDAEKELVDSLSVVPGLKILSEEAGELGRRDSRLVAVIDPLDGSSNFARGIPFYCTSVAIAEGDSLDDVSVGLVRNLVNGDVYFAQKGGGATKNGSPIKASSVTSLRDAVASVDVSRTRKEVIESLSQFICEVKRQVHFGANALELCLLAEGKTDALVDIRGSMRIVDLAAAYLIARESGATVTLPGGGELSIGLGLKERFSFVAAANPRLHRQVLAKLADG